MKPEKRANVGLSTYTDDRSNLNQIAEENSDEASSYHGSRMGESIVQESEEKKQRRSSKLP